MAVMEKSEEDWENKCMQIEDQRKEWAIIKWKKVEISSLHSVVTASGCRQGITESAGWESVVRINYRHRHITLRRVRQKPDMANKRQRKNANTSAPSILIRRLIC